MKVRKLLALALCAALGMGMFVPALAEEAPGSDQALMAVTAKVKETLGLDTEVYTDFQGWANENVLLGKRWNLEWTGDGVSLDITADDAGKVYSYSYNESASDVPVADSWYMGGKMNIPRLPEDKSQAAFAAAKDFLGKVLESGLETVDMENTYSPSLYQNTYRYSGEILLNGLSSPVSCSVTVRASDLKIIRFWRGDEGSGYLNGVPAVANNASEAQARRDLQGTLEFEARFVLSDDGKTATVQYVPLYRDDYYVDGETGKLVNLTELRKELWERGGGMEAPTADKNLMFTASEAAADTAGLTQAEKDGAAILQGALSKEDIDRAVQGAWPEIGLDRYTLAEASYSISKKELPEGQEATSADYDITCMLVYGKQEGKVLRNKYVVADAKTGELKSLYSRRWWQGEEEESIRYATGLVNAQAKADAILKSFAGTHSAVMALKDSTDAEKEKTWEHTFAYQQKAGDWFFDVNHYTVGVDATDGTISRLEGSFDEDVVLDVPTKIVTPGEAAEAYANAMDLKFGYLEVPVSVSLAGSDLRPLLQEAGYSYVLALKTGYVLAQPKDRYIRAVDAVTGEIIANDSQPGEAFAITYDDLEGHWVKTAADALAVFNIGLAGGSLKPGDELTQLDMVALLASVDGYQFDPQEATKETLDGLYNHAYFLGLVTPETRDEDKPVTRGELVRLILDAAGYTRIAALQGIFRCDFADSAAISAGDLGYAALAQGLGLVKGGSDGAYAAERVATRAEAIAMLYQYMK